MSIFVGIIAILIGAAYTFLGYKLFRILLPIWGLFAGISAGWTGTIEVLGDGFVAIVIAIIIALILGLIFAGLSWFFFSAAIVILGASFGYALSVALLNAVGIDFIITNVMVGIVGAMVLGSLAFAHNFRKFFVILLTSTAGASLMILGLLVFLGRIPVDALQYRQILDPIIADRFLWWVIWVVLSILGILQQGITKGTDWFEGYSYDEAAKKAVKESV